MDKKFYSNSSCSIEVKHENLDVVYLHSCKLLHFFSGLLNHSNKAFFSSETNIIVCIKYLSAMEPLINYHSEMSSDSYNRILIENRLIVCFLVDWNVPLLRLV